MENAANPRSYGPSAPIAVFEDKEGIPMGLLKNPDGGPYPPLLLKPVKKVPGNTLFEGTDKIGSTITYQLRAYPKIEDNTIYLERVEDIFKVPYPMEDKW